MALVDKLYWSQRYLRSTSGYGSYGKYLEKKLGWFKGLTIATISEIGCGDFNFGSNLLKLYPDAYYIGQDISELIIDKNTKKFPQYKFTTSINDLIQADLTLCIDVLFHITDDKEYENMLTNIENNWSKYLAITAYEYDNPLTSPHVKVRKFDYKRFGEPIIRKIIEEDGQLYFYLFKKKEIIDLSQVSCCLISKDHIYPQEVLDNIRRYPFGETLILTDSDSPYRKYELFKKAKFDTLYYQDDDAIVPVEELVKNYQPDIINVLMKPGHIIDYADKRYTMGLGWGCLFNKDILKSLKKYTDIYGIDAFYMREAERILTYFNYPQNRISADIVDLPSATASDRLWRQPNHHDYIELIKERCKPLI
jgi:hypothetical protein